MDSGTNDQEIADIVAQLQQLQLQQSVLLTRLTGISERNTEAEFFDTAADTPREFRIGDRVRIFNPHRFQAKKGVIVSIGEGRITVRASNGTRIQRSPGNHILDNSRHHG